MLLEALVPGTGNWLIVRLLRSSSPMFFAPFSVNQMLPSGPIVIPLGWTKFPGTVYSWSTWPEVETSAIFRRRPP